MHWPRSALARGSNWSSAMRTPRRIEQAAAGPDDAVDATVFWNYVDLKLRARHAWRLEVEITATELVLRIRAHAPPVAPRVMWRAPRDAGADALAPPVARGLARSRARRAARGSSA